MTNCSFTNVFIGLPLAFHSSNGEYLASERNIYDACMHFVIVLVCGFFVKLTAKTPEKIITDASLKIIWMLKIMERAPATTAPRAAPTLNIVDR